MLNQINDQVFTVSNFFTPEECKEAIEASEEIGYSAAPITTAFGPMHRPDVRNNTRVMVDDIEFSDSLWAKAKQFVSDWDQNWSPIGLNERLRYYRYDVGEQFNWHYDGCYERENGERSWVTFMVYLNGDFEGGETAFEKGLSVAPEEGMALFFVHQIRHKGMPVTAGRKYVLRTDVMYRWTA